MTHAVLCEDLRAVGVGWPALQHGLVLVWRLLPDAMAVACGVIMSTLTPSLRVPPGEEILRWNHRYLNWGQLCGIQLYYTAFGVLCLLQVCLTLTLKLALTLILASVPQAAWPAPQSLFALILTPTLTLTLTLTLTITLTIS